jgi:hypothetical protein
MSSDESDQTESDVATDPAVAGSRAVGGVEQPDAPDSNSTTGTTPSEEFVGRVAGQDVGYAGETGAERRAAVNEAAARHE